MRYPSNRHQSQSLVSRLFSTNLKSRRGEKKSSGLEYNQLEARQLLATLPAGVLDPGFGSDGWAFSQNELLNDSIGGAKQLIEVSNDKVLVVSDTYLARFDLTGQLDGTFGINGLLQLNGGDDEGYSKIAFTDQDDILYAYTKAEFAEIIVTKFDANGQTDTSFGDLGETRMFMSYEGPGYNNFGYLSVSDISVAPDGKIIVASNIRHDGDHGFGGGSNSVLTFVRVTESGHWDRTFGTDGRIELEVQGYQASEQSDGKTIWFGRNNAGSGDEELFRLNADQSLDTTFGVNGFVTIPGKAELFETQNPIVLENDKILLVGRDYLTGASGGGSTSGFWVQRFDADGTVDTSFGDKGSVLTDVNIANYPDAGARSVTELDDGSLLVIGDAGTDSDDAVTVAVKYDSTGNVVSTFGSDGVFSYDVSVSEYDSAFSAVEFADGRLLVGGQARVPRPNQEYPDGQMELIMLSANGVADISFDGDGVLLTDLALPVNYGGVVNGITEQTDGKILTTGTQYTDRGRIIFVARFNVDGTPDLTFGNEGKVTLDYTGYDEGNEIIVQPDGKIVVAGYVWDLDVNFSTGFALLRLNTDGSFDTSFGIDGIAQFNPSNANVYGYTATMLPTGDFLVGGIAYSSPGQGLIVKFDSTGQIDTTFGGSGQVYVANQIYDLAVQNDGKIIVNGQFNSNYDITRLNADGSPFDTLSSGFFGTALNVEVQDDGKIVVAGEYQGGAFSGEFGVVRYNENGTLDTSFGTNGLTSFEFTDSDPYVLEQNGLVIDSQGRIVTSGNTNGRFRIIRFLGDGSPDTSFGANNDGNGTVYYSPFGFERTYSLSTTSDNDIIVGGEADRSIGLSRLFGAPVPNADPDAITNSYDADEVAGFSGNFVLDDTGVGADVSPVGGSLRLVSINGTSIDYQVVTPAGAIITAFASGIVHYDTNGQFDYLEQGEIATDSFSYTIENLHGLTDSAVVFVTVNGVGIELTANSDQFFAEFNVRVEDSVASNDVGVSGDATFALLDGPSNGTIRLADDGSFIYRPTPGFIGVDRIDYRVTNGSGATSESFAEFEMGRQSLNNDLAAYWDFDNHAGDSILDVAVNDSQENSAIRINGASIDDNGFFGQAGRFDGVDDIAFVEASTEINDRALTRRSISLWFKPDALPMDGTHQVLFETGAQTGMNIYLHDGLLYVGAWNQISGPNGWSTFLATDPGQIEVGKWHHITLTMETPERGSGDLIGYLNGTEFDSGVVRLIFRHPAGTGIGGMFAGSAFHDRSRVTGNGEYFEGMIDDLRIYNRTLAVDEIEELAVPNIVDGLTVSWQADEGTGTILNDVSNEGNDNTAALVGATFTDDGFSGGAIQFDGVDDYVDITNSSDINTTRIEKRTISLWFNADEFTSGRQVLYEQGFQSGFNIFLDGSELVVGGYRNPNSGGWQHFFRTSNISTGTWHQVILVLDGGTAGGTFSAYVDGISIGSGAADWVNIQRDRASLGQMRGGAYFGNRLDIGSGHNFKGRIDDIRFFDRPLNDDELRALFWWA